MTVQGGGKIIQLRECLKQRGFQDLSNYESDVRLGQFLKEARRNVHRACEMYLQALKWRVSYGAMSLSTEAIPMECYLSKIAPIVLLDDSTTMYYRIGALLSAIAESKLKLDRKHIFRYMMKSFEVLMDAAITEGTSGQVLVDLTNVPTRVLLQRPLREFIHDLREFYRLYYPGIMDKIVYVNCPSSPMLVKFLAPFPSDSCTVRLCDGVHSGIEKLDMTLSQRRRLREIISDINGGLVMPMKKYKRTQGLPINIRRWNSAAEKAEAIEAQAEAEWISSESVDSLSSSWCSTSSLSSETSEDRNLHFSVSPKKLKKKVSWSDHLEQYFETCSSDTFSDDSLSPASSVGHDSEHDPYAKYHEISPGAHAFLKPSPTNAEKAKTKTRSKCTKRMKEEQAGVLNIWELSWWYGRL